MFWYRNACPVDQVISLAAIILVDLVRVRVGGQRNIVTGDSETVLLAAPVGGLNGRLKLIALTIVPCSR